MNIWMQSGLWLQLPRKSGGRDESALIEITTGLFEIHLTF